MIREAKDVLQSVVQTRVPEANIVRSVAEESRAIMARKWPLVTLVTNPGNFDDREAKTFRYADAEAGTLKQRYVRGSRILPILLRCWAEGEDAADEMFSRIIPAIPRKWEYDGFEGTILINHEEHSDFVDSVTKLFLSVAEIQFTVPVALDEEVVPTIKAVDSEPEA
ncbi:hypothetical protein FACS1894147_02460 [Spirochaetia bacterium]|nr:hypothetical protein FACS1894147_02460 [Spirochaetia bacterium]